ncbi:MAG: hypothetical protein WC608_03090 [Parcubacteria group bacterium]
MKTFAYITGALLLAIGLKFLIGWPFWIVILAIVIGAGLHLLKLGGNGWTAPIAVIASIFIIGTLTFQFLTGRLPLTASFLNHIWMGSDVKSAAKATEPVVKARATALNLQIAREDATSDKILEYYKEGKIDEAKELLKKAIAEGMEIRNIVSLKNILQSSDNQSAQAPAPAPAPMAMPAQVAAATPTPASLLGNWKLKYDKDLNNTWWSSRVLITEVNDRIIIAKQGTGQIFFEGQDLGGNKFKGIWHEGPTNAQATMYLPSPSNNFASGRIEMDNGTIMPIQIES